MMVFGFSGLRLWCVIAVAAVFALPVYDLSLANPVASKPGTLAFSSYSLQRKSNGLFTIQADGRDRRRMTRVQDTNLPLWSPDGKRLAFTANYQQDLYVTNADGSQLITVFQGDFCKASSLRFNWTADSQQLVFVIGCDASTSDTPGLQALYVRNLARGGKTKLIQEWKIGGFPPDTEITSPVYPSPDGRYVSFIKNQNLYRMNSDGSGLTQVTNGNQQTQPDYTLLYWSPDSRKVARMDFFPGDVPMQQISIFDWDGKLLRQWRNPGISWSDPNLIWSPDSQRVAYYHTEGLQQDIYLYDLAWWGDKRARRQT
ncbi:MAG: hypothetical protein VKL42_17640 [Snowella sp.]|nr:hypothetical protein [Snowella sp.]